MTHPDLRSVTKVEIAFAADLDMPPSTWVWTDVTADLRSQTMSITRGRQDEMSQTQPSEVRVVLDNGHGHYTPGSTRSQYWPHVVVGTPLRITVNGSVRFAGHIGSWELVWPYGDVDDESVVTVTAAGPLRRLGQGAVLESALRRYYLALPDVIGYLPLEESSRASNIVPGTTPAGVRRVVWGGDDSCPGSAPLPEWLPTAYYPGAYASVLDSAGGPEWSVYVSVRVPSAGVPCHLAEWRTTGSLPLWQLRVDAGGELEVRAIGDDTARTISTGIRVANNEWHTVVVAAEDEPGGGSVTVATGDDGYLEPVPAGEVGKLLGMRPVPALDSPTGDSEPIGLGHLMALGVNRIWHSPVDGWAGEPATGRIIRLCTEAGIPAEVRGQPLMVDDFDRTEATGWGSTPDGYEWDTDGVNVDFSVADGVATMSTSGVPAVGTAAVDAPGSEVDLLAAVELVGTDQMMLIVSPRSLASLVVDGVTQSVLLVGDDTVEMPYTITTGVRYWLRMQSAGSYLRARIWPDGDPEPRDWPLAIQGWPNGGARVDLETVFDATGELQLSHFALTSLDSVAMGPEPTGTLLDALHECEAADMGMLHEQRDMPGLRYVTRAALYNAPASLVLDAEAGEGDIVNPFIGVDDDAGLRNDVSVQRTNGGEARAVDPDSMALHGVYADTAEVNLASDNQLPDQATWRLWLGTQPGPRYPSVSPALDVRAALIAPWQAVDIGDRVDVVGLPAQHPGSVRQIIQGVVETYSPARLGAAATLAPAAPYEVAVWDQCRYAPGVSTLAAPADLTGTGQVVLQVQGEEWTTDPADWDDPAAGPLELLIAGVRVRVVSIDPPAGGVQQITVTRVSDVPRVAPAGSAVDLADARPWAL